jgi:nitroreductase/dihydropteridine reductase
MPLLDELTWRYATKIFDPARNLGDDQLDTLLECYRLCATSFGLQPGRLLVVEDAELRARLRAAAWNQSQVTDASHLLVLTHRVDVTAAEIDAHVARCAASRGVEPAALQGFGGMMKGFVEARGPEFVKEWNNRQGYIALGWLMVCCARLGIDSCPMEGFEADKVNGILDLPARGLAVTALLPVGFRSASDSYAATPKTRKPLDELVERL